MKRNQQGITFLSFVIVLAVVGFFLYIGMKLIPVYTQFYSANNGIKAMVQSPGANQRDLQSFRTELEKRFNISYVDTIDLKKDIKMSNDNGAKQLQLKYEVRRPLFYNLDFVAKFDKSYDLSGKPAIE
mgnify:CR=1 FL=1